MSPNFFDCLNSGQQQACSGCQDGVEFAMGTDTKRVVAALGINTFFTGSNAFRHIAVNDMVHLDTNFIAAGAVNGQFQVNVGDNITATAIGKLVDRSFGYDLHHVEDGKNNRDHWPVHANPRYHRGFGRGAFPKTNTEYHTALTNDLFDFAPRP